MRLGRAAAAAVLGASVLLAGCDAGPVVTRTPSAGVPSPAGPSSGAVASATPSEVPFRPASWPADGSACGTSGYRGLLGRIEAPDARTVRFTLCEPDGAFLARLAHPALTILDTASVERLAADRSSARAMAGTGPYHIDAWENDANVRLVRTGDASADAVAPTLVLTWDGDPARRTIALQSAVVDGIDAPGPTDLDRISTEPELAVTQRDGMATAYLGFGTGSGFGRPSVRRAIAQALDRDALVQDAFAAGTAVATHTVPCEIDAACGGDDWFGFNAPNAGSLLDAAKFDLTASYPLRIPDQPIPGLPDPSGTAAAVAKQLDANLGLTVVPKPMPLGGYLDNLAHGGLDGLYLGGVASTVADPNAFLEPLFGRGVRSTAATRVPSIQKDLATAARIADPAARAAAYTRINETIRDSSVIVPLAHPGSTTAFRSDVTGVVASPAGMDPLGAFTPGDRSQLVFMQGSQPDGAYCGDQASPDAARLCGLVLQGLYGYRPGTLTPEPQLAESCQPDASAEVWTCRLRDGVRFSDGAKLDAGDVLSTFVAQWDRSQRLRAGSKAPFAAWTALFGDTIGGG